MENLKTNNESQVKVNITDSSTKKYFRGAIIACLVTLLVVSLIYSFNDYTIDFNAKVNYEKLSSYGTLLAALTGLILGFLTVLLLYRAYLSQKAELEATVDALNKTREIADEQSKTQVLQQFENTFFALLGFYQKVLDGIDIEIDVNASSTTHGLFYEPEFKVFTGKDCFKEIFLEFSRNYKSDKEKLSEIDKIKKVYKEIYQKYQSDLGPYFKNVYHILKFVHKNENRKKHFYTNLLRAQLSPYEILVIFYNGLSIYGEQKAKPLIETYHFLKHVPREKILDEAHFNFYEQSAFGKSQISNY